jgi:hypothetical protein
MRRPGGLDEGVECRRVGHSSGSSSNSSSNEQQRLAAAAAAAAMRHPGGDEGAGCRSLGGAQQCRSEMLGDPALDIDVSVSVSMSLQRISRADSSAQVKGLSNVDVA